MSSATPSRAVTADSGLVPVIRWAAPMLSGLVLALFVTAPALPSVQPAAAPPAWAPAGISYSVAPGDPLTALGVHPADIVGSDGTPSVPCANLGLVCSDSAGFSQDDILGLSFGQDFAPTGLVRTLFTVDASSQGVPGSAVRGEAGCAYAEAESDVFGTDVNGAGTSGAHDQVLDGDGVPCASSAGLPLFLSEGRYSDRLDDLDAEACRFVDGDCDGVPEAPVFFTLAPGSPSLYPLGASSSDILTSYGAQVPVVWAGAAGLGLAPGDIVDALCVRESGDGRYGPGDLVLLSLARGSPTLTALGAGAADMIRPGSPPTVYLRAAALGLMPSDNVSGMACAFTLSYSQFLPLVMRAR